MIRFLIHHCVVGIVVGWTFMAALLTLNIGSLRTLIWQSDVTVLALAMLAFFLAITFGSLAMGTAVMSQGSDSGAGRRRRRLDGMTRALVRMPVWAPARATVPAQTRAKRRRL